MRSAVELQRLGGFDGDVPTRAKTQALLVVSTSRSPSKRSRVSPADYAFEDSQHIALLRIGARDDDAIAGFGGATRQLYARRHGRSGHRRRFHQHGVVRQEGYDDAHAAMPPRRRGSREL